MTMDGLVKYLPHLLELRKRTCICVLAFIGILLPLLFWSGALYTQVAQPLLKILPEGSKLIATAVITPFTGPLKLALFASFILTVPLILYHIWAFVAPGLYPKEKKAIRPLIVLSIGLFYAGMSFAHFVILPMALSFFVHIAPKDVTVMTDIQHYLDFVLALYFGFGLAFQVPIATFLLCHANLTSVETLQKHRPYIIVAAFIIGMLLTPPDVISQILLAVPLLLLFEFGLLLAKCQTRNKHKHTHNPSN